MIAGRGDLRLRQAVQPQARRFKLVAAPIRCDIARDYREVWRERVSGGDGGLCGAHILTAEMNIAQMDEPYGHDLKVSSASPPCRSH